MRRRFRLIASVALLPALVACDSAADAPVPVGQEAMQAVVRAPGTDREDLARAIDALFEQGETGESHAVIVMYRGQIVAERYGPDYSAKMRFTGWSMSKAVTAIAIGMLVAEGRLQIDGSPPIRHWLRSGDPRGEITLRQLLQMRSGLRHTERAEPEYEGDTVRMLFLDGRDDMARWAEAQPLKTEPGRIFEYSTASSIILSDIIARVLAPEATAEHRRAAVAEFMRGRLFEPAGLHSMVPEFDRAGTMTGGAMIHATARDWAGLGEFLRHKGSVRGAQIVPRRWVEFMTRPSPRAPDYGAQLWLNRESGNDRAMLFPHEGPASLFAAIGHQGQYLIVSPEQKLTIVRLGVTTDEQQAALRSALARIVRLYKSS